MTKDDGTVARIAGNLLSGIRPNGPHGDRKMTSDEEALVRWAVAIARGIVKEVEDTAARPWGDN